MHASTLGNARSVTSWSRQNRASVAYSAPTARRNVRRDNGKRALPNNRLKLAAPGSQGRIAFVIANLVLRSLSASR